MARKLTDEELGQRTRTMQRLRSERQRQRMQGSGKSALTVWIDAEVKVALNQTAIERGATIAETATALLSAALTTTPNQTTTTPDTATRASNDSTVDLFGDSKPVDLSAPRADPNRK